MSERRKKNGQRNPAGLPLRGGAGSVNILKGLAKARHPSAKAAAKASTEVAKAATHTPASQNENKKRSCGIARPASMRTSGEESASLHKSASILASLRNGPSKKQRSLKEPRALPLRPISTYKRYCEAACHGMALGGTPYWA